MSRIYNRSYHSVQGFDVYIDSHGDAEGNFTVIALQEDLSLIQSNRSFKMSMQPVGYFLYNKSEDIPEFKYINKNRPIRWIRGTIPRAEPECGFNGELCAYKKRDWKYFLSAVFLLLLIAVAAAFLIKYINYKPY